MMWELIISDYIDLKFVMQIYSMQVMGWKNTYIDKINFIRIKRTDLCIH